MASGVVFVVNESKKEVGKFLLLRNSIYNLKKRQKRLLYFCIKAVWGKIILFLTADYP